MGSDNSAAEEEAKELEAEREQEMRKAQLERIQMLKRAQGQGGLGMFDNQNSTLG